MRSIFIIAAAAGFAVLPILTGPAQAQANRTFVSGHGEDTNPCTLAAPCRTFARAITQTNTGGEITVLDSAGYGPLTITKSVSIVNPGGVEAGISVPSGGTGILITGGSVALRGLTLEGAGIGQDGIKFTGGSRLEIVDCIVRDFTHDGIYINQSSGAMTLSISNTIASDNRNDGIDIGPAPGDGSASVSGSVYQSLTNNNAGVGIVVFGQNGANFLSIAVSGGVSDSNGVGVLVTGPGPGLSQANTQLNDITISNNSVDGIHSSGGIVTLSHVRLSLNSGSNHDITNDLNSTLAIVNNTTATNLINNGIALTDGTNDIFGLVSPNALMKQAPQ